MRRGKKIEQQPERRHRSGIFTLLGGLFPAILRQKPTIGVSLTMGFLLVLRKKSSPKRNFPRIYAFFNVFAKIPK